MEYVETLWCLSSSPEPKVVGQVYSFGRPLSSSTFSNISDKPKNFRNACLFWSKQATHILKTIKILLLMVQFHNAPSNFENLASGGGRHWLSEPIACFRIMGKEICFHKIGPIMMPKWIGYKISMIFFICKCRWQDDQNWYSWSHEMCFKNLFLELVTCDVRNADNYGLCQKCRRCSNLSINVHFS